VSERPELVLISARPPPASTEAAGHECGCRLARRRNRGHGKYQGTPRPPPSRQMAQRSLVICW
jgi:hypothetical protein